MRYSTGRPSFGLNRRKTIRFQSVIVLPAVMGLEPTEFTLVRQWKTLLGLRPFAFLLFSAATDTYEPLSSRELKVSA